MPVGVFAAVWAAHYLWLAVFPETAGTAQSQWVTFDSAPEVSDWQRYVASKSYLLGYVYALSLAFAASSYRLYREKKSCDARRVTVGSIGFSGMLGAGSCFLLGCCGSPMLGVYISLFGAGFAPLAKPAVAALSTVMIGGTWLWMDRKVRLASEVVADCGCEPGTSVAGGKNVCD